MVKIKGLIANPIVGGCIIFLTNLLAPRIAILVICLISAVALSWEMDLIAGRQDANISWFFKALAFRMIPTWLICYALIVGFCRFSIMETRLCESGFLTALIFPELGMYLFPWLYIFALILIKLTNKR